MLMRSSLVAVAVALEEITIPTALKVLEAAVVADTLTLSEKLVFLRTRNTALLLVLVAVEG